MHKGKVPTIVPNFGMNYTTPKLYIKRVNGKPCVDRGCNWYVWYRFRNEKGKMEKFIEKKGINRYKTVTERTLAGKRLAKAMLGLLQNGYNPIEKRFEKEQERKTLQTDVINAFQNAFDVKKGSGVWNEASLENNTGILDNFFKYINTKFLNHLNIKELTKIHLRDYLYQLDMGNPGKNNHRRLLSSLYTQMISDDVVEFNLVSNIPKFKENPRKNKAFTKQQLKDIKDYLIAHDDYLLKYIYFIMYAVLRPIEVNRLKVKDIDTDRGLIYDQTKTGHEIVKIIKRLKPIINKLNLEKYNRNDTVFTYKEFPFDWKTKSDKIKYSIFNKRFFKVKEALGLGDEYGLYSFRHTVVLNLYHSYLKQGMTNLQAKQKIMSITRHKSMKSTEKYLRNIGAFVPVDYSDDFTLDF